jgi:glucose 1-dehydrogenase
MASSAAKFGGKVAFVTGAANGIGRATALALAQDGADVAVNDLKITPAFESLAEEIRALGRRVVLCPADVSDQAAVEAAVAHAVANLGRLDLLVTAAVYSDREPFNTANMVGFRRTVDVSMWGAFHALRAAANQMVQQGQGGGVVIVSSPHAVTPYPTCMAYNMAKAALDMMARTAALELIKDRIRVNVIYPGWTDTPGERKFFSEDTLHKAATSLPVGRLARPEEIARGIVFLLDPASEYITGSTLWVDGGSHLPWWSRRGTGDF